MATPFFESQYLTGFVLTSGGAKRHHLF